MHLEKRPSELSVATLLQQTGPFAGDLRQDLIEHHDYEAVPPEVWRYLTKWYGFASEQQAIMRMITFDRAIGKFYVDLYMQSHLGQDQSSLLDQTDVEIVDTNLIHI